MHRERAKAPVTSKSGAQRWAEARERVLFERGPEQPRKEVPRLGAFADQFMRGHAIANRQKPSAVVSKRHILDRHLIPALGDKKLDAITNSDVQQLKHALRDRAPKTVNNILTVLSVLLKKAVEWDVVERLPCAIRLLKVTRTAMGFWDFEEYARLIDAAQTRGPQTHAIVLLGGDAGLRCGEIIGLEWGDVDFAKRQLCVQRSEWRRHVTAPKGGRLRYVPMTRRLASVLHGFVTPGARASVPPGRQGPHTERRGQGVRRAARLAEVPVSGVHRLRHTFCSHLAMRGAPARAIQELAGHQDLVDDPALHAPEPGRARDRDRAAGAADAERDRSRDVTVVEK